MVSPPFPLQASPANMSAKSTDRPRTPARGTALALVQTALPHSHYIHLALSPTMWGERAFCDWYVGGKTCRLVAKTTKERQRKKEEGRGRKEKGRKKRGKKKEKQEGCLGQVVECLPSKQKFKPQYHHRKEGKLTCKLGEKKGNLFPRIHKEFLEI